MESYQQKMIREMRIRNFSTQTQDVYLKNAERLCEYFGRPPELISSDEIKEFVLRMEKGRSLSSSTVSTYIHGYKFLVNVALKREADPLVVDKRRREKKLPVVFSREEVKTIVNSCKVLRHKAFILTAYSTGVRISELANLKLEDIDSGRMLIHVRQGKMSKDRYTVLTPRLLQFLRIYYKKYKPRTYLFPAASIYKPVSIGTIFHSYKRVYKRTGITKQATFHTLRHSFATHMLEAGVDIRTIQLMMGHASIQTTATYLKVTNKEIALAGSKVDLLKFF